MKDGFPRKAACCLPGEPGVGGGVRGGRMFRKAVMLLVRLGGGCKAQDDNMASAVAGWSCPACALVLPGALSAWCCHMPQCATCVPHHAACVPHRVACVPHHAACLRTTLCCVHAPSCCPPPCPIMLFVSVLHLAACLPHCTACVPRVGAELGMLWRKEQRQGVPLRTAQYGVKLGMLFKSDKVLSNILEVRDAGTGDDLASKGWLGLWVAQLSQWKNDQPLHACLFGPTCRRTACTTLRRTGCASRCTAWWQRPAVHQGRLQRAVLKRQQQVRRPVGHALHATARRRCSVQPPRTLLTQLHHYCMTLEPLIIAAMFWFTVAYALPTAIATSNSTAP